MSFERDLERWELGDISDDELVRSHPGEEVVGLLALHERMIGEAAASVSLDEGALQRLLARLPDRARPRRRYRSVLLAVAAVLLTASMAVAVPGVHHGVTAITQGVGRLLGIERPAATVPAPSDVPAAPPPNDTTGDQLGGSGGSGDADDHPTGGHEGAGSEGDQGQDQQSDGNSGGSGDQGQDQQSDGNSGGSGDGGSGSSGSSSGGDTASSGDQTGDGSGGDTESSSSGGGGEQ
jgi:hypothetical protein